MLTKTVTRGPAKLYDQCGYDRSKTRVCIVLILLTIVVFCRIIFSL